MAIGAALYTHHYGAFLVLASQTVVLVGWVVPGLRGQWYGGAGRGREERTRGYGGGRAGRFLRRLGCVPLAALTTLLLYLPWLATGLNAFLANRGPDAAQGTTDGDWAGWEAPLLVWE